MKDYPGRLVLLDFLAGKCRDERVLADIEAELDTHFRDDEIVHDFVVDIARYSKSGGDYFIGEDEMVGKVRRITEYLDRKAG